jgi:hypothetical protein
MKTIHLGLMALLFGLCISGLQAQSNEAIQKAHLRFLEKQGIEGWIDSDGDIQFKHNDRTFFIEVDEDDPHFFRIVLANIWPIESEMERLQALEAVDYANAQIKVTKAFIVRDNVWISVEVFLDELGDYEAFFDRSLSVIESGIDRFVEKMREE